MRVFISHSFNDRDTFSDLEQVLLSKKIECFQPDQMLIGRGLSEMLLIELKACDALVFVATKNSIKSAWCNAELGAAWGLGKLVAIHLHDSDLNPNDLPPQFVGLLMHKSMFKIADNLHQQLGPVRKDENNDNENTKLSSLIRLELQRERVFIWSYETFLDLRILIDNEKWNVASKKLEVLMYKLVNQRYADIAKPRAAGWPFYFVTVTTTGSWHGWSLGLSEHADGNLEIYENCILLHLDEDGLIDGVSAAKQVLEERTTGMLGLSPWTDHEETPTVTIGKTALGRAIVQ